jgi:hypothetical protein
LLAACIAWGALAATAAGLVVPEYLLVGRPYWRTGIPPGDWTPGTMLAGLVFSVGLLACLAFILYQRFGTIVSERGVSMPTLRGRCDVSWADIERVDWRGVEFVLGSPKGRLIVNTACFTDARSVADYVRARLAAAHRGAERDTA